MTKPLLRLAVLTAGLCGSAFAADLTIDGQQNVLKAPGTTMDWSLTGTPGAIGWLLLDVDAGPTMVFGQSLEIGFTPSLILTNLGALSGAGALDFTATTPTDPSLIGLTVYGLGAVADGPFAAQYSFTSGVSVTIGDRGDELAGNPLGAYPHFEFVRAFNEFASVSVAVDTSRYPATVGVTADVYVVDAKTSAEWQSDPSLVDVSGDGAEVVTFTAGSITANTLTVDTGTLSGDAFAGLGVGYDIVVDLNRDGLLDDDDLIDGFGDEAGLYVVRDTTQPGPLAVTEALYSGGNFLGQNLFYPTDIANMGRVPLIVISHGNGHNYQWYDHLGTHLASYGFVVMSHENNTGPGIETSSTTTLTNTDFFLGRLDTIEGGILEGHIETDKMVWFGHSRGGEGVARAYDRIFDGDWVPVNYEIDDIVLLSSMAPTDFLGPSQTDPHDATYHVWVAGADADVNGCASNDIAEPLHIHDRAEQKRMAISLHGVGHGDFHNSSGSVASGPCLVGKPNTHLIQLGYALPLFMHHARDNVPSEDFLWRQYESFHPAGAPTFNPCVVVDLQYRAGAAETFVIDDFQTNTTTATSSSGGTVTSDVAQFGEGQLNDPNGTFSDNGALMNGMTYARNNDTTRGAVFQFNNADLEIAYEIVAAGQDASGFDYLSFRACQSTRDALTTASLGDLTFSVELKDGTGNASTINIGVYGGGVEEPYQRTGCGTGAGWNNEFETIRLRLADFEADGSGIDLADLATLTLKFGPSSGSSQGRLGIDDIAFTND
ncbi:MAG: hypothetical protein ACI9EF_001483 [Pseudohongiellaceae bacterium]